jgi:hypothetical protein
MNVLIIAYTKESAQIANKIAETINGCIYIVQAPKDRKAYWQFLNTKAADFGVEYVVEVSTHSKYCFTYRNVHDIFYTHEVTSIEDNFNPQY